MKLRWIDTRFRSVAEDSPRRAPRLSAIIPAKTVIRAVVLPLIFLGTATAAAADAIPDTDISDHIERELSLDPAVPYDAIDVQTDDGIVSLTGRVTNLLARERAVLVAETVRGVRAVVNRIEVNPVVSRTPEALADAVREALLYDSATDAYELTVNANRDGRVTLAGSVDSWQERNLAEIVAKGVNGVTAVNNEIVIVSKLERKDAELQPEIDARLKWDALVDDGLINVKVVDGEARLTGTVGSAAEKRRAEWDAWVNGVKAVDSSGLKVERWARDTELRQGKYLKHTDAEISSAVQASLLYDPRVKAYNLDVVTADGIVTLRGVVDDIQAKNSAIRDARNTVGVAGVNNLVKVRPIAALPDERIAYNVRSALLRNPYTTGFDIGVEVRDHAVQLNGVVDTDFEKATAQNVAFRAEGVSAVRNNLEVNHPGLLTYDPYIYGWSIYDYPWYQGPAPGAYKSDWRIRQDIEDELIWSPFVDRDEIGISVENRVATLTGTVDSWNEYAAASENAYEGGAISVINKLEVR